MYMASFFLFQFDRDEAGLMAESTLVAHENKAEARNK